MLNYKTRDKLSSFLFVLPALVIFLAFYVYPLFFTFWLSLHRVDMISPGSFVGLANFKDVLFYDKNWWPSFYNAGFITFFALTFQNLLAFMLALGVDKAVRTGNIYRAIFFILPILSEIIIGLLMKEMLVKDPGVLNHFLAKIGLSGLQANWLGKEMVLFTTALVHCWKGFGWGFIIFLAGLQTIPQQLYEAARIDGANAWHSFTKITLPLMVPVSIMVIILTILGSMQSFGMILALTRGAGGLTEVPVMRIFNHLKDGQAGIASCEGLIIGVVLVIASFSMLKISQGIKKKYGVE